MVSISLASRQINSSLEGEMELIAVMNNTKWDELRLAMYELGTLTPRWRTRCVENGYLTDWDREWFYHFREGGYEITEWVEIEATSNEQDSAIYKAISRIHVPGERVEGGYRVYGYVPVGKAIGYL